MIYQDLDKLCKNPVASLFVFTYKQENLVGQTIESMLAQRCDFEYEIIICDDFSPDLTLKTCLSYQKVHPDRIRVVENEKNLGMRGNFFTNISTYTRGKFVAICAGDDWWLDPLKIQKQVGFLMDNPDYSFVHTQAKVYVDKEKRFLDSTIGFDFSSFRDNLKRDCLAALTMCFTFSSFLKFIEEANPIELPYSEDYPTILWYSYRCKVKFIPEPTSAYRLLDQSLSHTNDIEKIYQGPLDFFNCGMHFVRLFNINDPVMEKMMLKQLYINRMRYAYLLGDKENCTKGEEFFKNNNCIAYYWLSKIYGFAGKNKKANTIVNKLSRIVNGLSKLIKN